MFNRKKTQPSPASRQPSNLNYSDFTGGKLVRKATPPLTPTPITEVVSPAPAELTNIPKKVNFFNDPKHENLRQGLKIAAVIAAILAVIGVLVALSLLSPGIGLIPVIGGMGLKAAGIGASTAAAHTAIAGGTLATAKTSLFAAFNTGAVVTVSNGKAVGLLVGIFALLGVMACGSGCGNGQRRQFND